MILLAYVTMWAATAVYVLHSVSEARRAGWAASGATALAWALLTASLVRRGLSAGHWPLANRYEFALCFTWSILAVHLLLEVSWGDRRAGPYVLSTGLLVATYALTRPAEMKLTALLLPILRSVWLQVHVATAAIAYGALGVAGGLGLFLLAEGRAPAAEQAFSHATERMVALGFPWLTLSILAGAIWAQKAWGRYWGWDPKETWALITWLWYLMVLHLAPLKRWRGRRLAMMAVVGFAIVLFTFAGVPWLVRVVRLETLHGY